MDVVKSRLSGIVALISFGVAVHGQEVAVIADGTIPAGSWPPPPSKIILFDLNTGTVPSASIDAGPVASAIFVDGGKSLAVASHSIATQSVAVDFYSVSKGARTGGLNFPSLRLPSRATVSYDPHPVAKLIQSPFGGQYLLVADSPTLTIPSSVRAASLPGSIPINPVCEIVRFDQNSLIGRTTLSKTTSLFASLLSPGRGDTDALLTSGAYTANLVYTREVTVYTDKAVDTVTLNSEPLSLTAMASAGGNNIVALAPNLGWYELSASRPLGASQKIPLIADPGVRVPYQPIALLATPSQGVFVSLNVLVSSGGVDTNESQLVLINTSSKRITAGPVLSNMVLKAVVSNDGTKAIILAANSPQLSVYAIPSFRLLTKVDQVITAPIDVAAY